MSFLSLADRRKVNGRLLTVLVEFFRRMKFDEKFHVPSLNMRELLRYVVKANACLCSRS